MGLKLMRLELLASVTALSMLAACSQGPFVSDWDHLANAYGGGYSGGLRGAVGHGYGVYGGGGYGGAYGAYGCLPAYAAIVPGCGYGQGYAGSSAQNASAGVSHGYRQITPSSSLRTGSGQTYGGTYGHGYGAAPTYGAYGGTYGQSYGSYGSGYAGLRGSSAAGSAYSGQCVPTYIQPCAPLYPVAPLGFPQYPAPHRKTGFSGASRLSFGIGVEPVTNGSFTPEPNAPTHYRPHYSFLNEDRGNNVFRHRRYEALSDHQRIVQDIDYADAWDPAITLDATYEMDLSDTMATFARISFSQASGKTVLGATQVGSLVESVTNWGLEGWEADTDPFLSPAATQLGNDGIVATYANAPLGRTYYEFDDFRRVGLDVGAKYFPLTRNYQTARASLIPYLSTSVGLARYNEMTVGRSTESLHQVNWVTTGQEAYFSGDAPNFVAPLPDVVTLYDSQWMASLHLAAGAEWLLTPQSHISVEAGLRVDSGNFDGADGEPRISAPIMARAHIKF